MRNALPIVVAVWAVFILLLAPPVDTDLHAYTVSHRANDLPVALQMLGEARAIVSNMSILQADIYMHGGVGHFYEEHGGGMAITEEEGHDEHGHGALVKPKISTWNVLLKLSEAVAITDHKHLHGSEASEMIPWLYYAARTDPNNVMAYSLTAFWLGDKLGKVEDALAFLKEGLSYNPSSWELDAEIGRIYFQHLKDYGSAERYLLRADGILAAVKHDRYQERYVLAWLAASYEAEGRHKDAIPVYLRLKELFPETTVYDGKIKELEGTR